ncbi:MAG: hypothetical protein ABIE42_04485 [Candidatus Eisenbacteria bacterium]
MSTRRILGLLVVLALSLGLCSVPAGSATLQRPSVTGDSVTTVTTFKDGDDGEDIDGGDDDRWGNNTVIGRTNGDPAATGGDEEDDDVIDEARLLGRLGVLRIEIRTLFGFLVVLL